jgi:hypothetical protein
MRLYVRPHYTKVYDPANRVTDSLPVQLFSGDYTPWSLSTQEHNNKSHSRKEHTNKLRTQPQPNDLQLKIPCLSRLSFYCRERLYLNLLRTSCHHPTAPEQASMDDDLRKKTCGEELSSLLLDNEIVIQIRLRQPDDERLRPFKP